MVGRILSLYDNSKLASESQFGFRKARSTEDAVEALIPEPELGDKYAVRIFLDIEGAFDNLWWPSILRRLRQVHCPDNLYRLVRSCLAGRMIRCVQGDAVVEASPEKG